MGGKILGLRAGVDLRCQILGLGGLMGEVNGQTDKTPSSYYKTGLETQPFTEMKECN